MVVIAAAIFLLVVAVFQEFGPLVDQINKWLAEQGPNGAAAITDYLKSLGLTQDQINGLTTDLANFLRGLASDVVPVTAGLLTVIFNAVIVGMVSIYLVLDGSRFLKWATGKTPVAHPRNVSFFVQSLDRVMGGYIRGQLLLCLAISVMIAVFMGAHRRAVLAGAGGARLHLRVHPDDWPLARRRGLRARRALTRLGASAGCADSGHCRQRDRGQHPLAAPAGTRGRRPSARLTLLPARLCRDLRSVGRFFAAPIAGFIQAIATAFWRQWRSNHPEQYPEDVDAQIQGQESSPNNGAGQLPAPAHAQEIAPPAVDPAT